MRISTSQKYNDLSARIQANEVAMARISARLASGKKVEKPSDDPFAAVGILTFRAAKTVSDQHASTANSVIGKLKLAENALSEIHESLKQTRKIALQGANDSLDPAGRDALVKELRQLQTSLLRNANVQDANGNYLFAGFKTSTKPFEVSANPPRILEYHGDSNKQLVEVGPATMLPANMIVDKTIISAFAAIEDAVTRLESADTAGLSGISLLMIEDALKAINTVRGEAGVMLNQFQSSAESAIRRSDEFLKQISDREDADLAETIVEMQKAQTAYQASLAAFTAVTRMSLLDYL